MRCGVERSAGGCGAQEREEERSKSKEEYNLYYK